jgi:hypothetical protein
MAAATTFTLTAPNPANGFIRNASGNFTVTPDDTYTGTVTLTPTGGGLSTPVVLTWASASTAKTFTLTPTVAGTVTVTATNSGSLTNAVPVTYTADALTLACAPTWIRTLATTELTMTTGGGHYNTVAPTFSFFGVGDVVPGAVTVTGDTTATVSVIVGAYKGTMTVRDSSTGASASVPVCPSRIFTAVASYGAANTGLTLGMTILNSDDTVFLAHSTAHVVEHGATGVYVGAAILPCTFSGMILFDAPEGVAPIVCTVEQSEDLTSRDSGGYPREVEGVAGGRYYVAGRYLDSHGDEVSPP